MEGDQQPFVQTDPAAPTIMCCEFCKSTQTPLWRRGPNGKATLCNACGVRWMRQQSQLVRAERDKNAPKREAPFSEGTSDNEDEKQVEIVDDGPRKARLKHTTITYDDTKVFGGERHTPVRRKIKHQRKLPPIDTQDEKVDKMIVEMKAHFGLKQEVLQTLERNLAVLRSKDQIQESHVELAHAHERRDEMKKREKTVCSQLLDLHRMCQDKIKRASESLRSSRSRVMELEQKINEIRTHYRIDVPLDIVEKKHPSRNVLDVADIRGDGFATRSAARTETLVANKQNEVITKATDVSRAAAAVVASSKKPSA